MTRRIVPNPSHAPRSSKETRPCPKCGEEMTFEPADPCYGADADGNRGRYIPASWACECGHTQVVEPDDNDRHLLSLRKLSKYD